MHRQNEMRQQTQEKIEVILSLYKREDISTREALRRIEEAMDRELVEKLDANISLSPAGLELFRWIKLIKALSYRQIAQELGCSIGSVSGHSRKWFRTTRTAVKVSVDLSSSTLVGAGS